MQKFKQFLEGITLKKNQLYFDPNRSDPTDVYKINDEKPHVKNISGINVRLYYSLLSKFINNANKEDLLNKQNKSDIKILKSAKGIQGGEGMSFADDIHNWDSVINWSVEKFIKRLYHWKPDVIIVPSSSSMLPLKLAQKASSLMGSIPIISSTKSNDFTTIYVKTMENLKREFERKEEKEKSYLSGLNDFNSPQMKAIKDEFWKKVKKAKDKFETPPDWDEFLASKKTIKWTDPDKKIHRNWEDAITSDILQAEKQSKDKMNVSGALLKHRQYYSGLHNIDSETIYSDGAKIQILIVDDSISTQVATIRNIIEDIKEKYEKRGLPFNNNTVEVVGYAPFRTQ